MVMTVNYVQLFIILNQLKDVNYYDYCHYIFLKCPVHRFFTLSEFESMPLIPT